MSFKYCFNTLIVSVALLPFTAMASAEKFSKDVYENFHAGKMRIENLRDYIEAQDYIGALRTAEERLLPLDLASADPRQIAEIIEEIGSIIAQHNDVGSLEPDQSWMSWAEEQFRTHDTASDFEASNPSRCAVQSVDFKRFMRVAAQTLPHADKNALNKRLAFTWVETRNKWPQGTQLLDLAQTDFGAVLVFNAILCAKMSKESQSDSSALRTSNGVWIWDLDYSGAGMHILGSREKKLRKNLGRRYDDFLNQYNDALQNNRYWKYPGVVTYVPAFDDAKKALLGFVQDLQSRLKVASKLEAAAFAHEHFVKNHFLTDGNGRMGRLLANAILAQAGLKPLIVKNDPCYMKATEDGFENLQLFLDFMKDPSCKMRDRTEL